MVALCSARALAIAEFCPAEIQPIHPLDSKMGLSALYSYSLHAEGPRSVSGSVFFDTSSGWFVATFPSTPLTVRQYHMEDEFVTFTHATFESDALYVRFPQPLTIKGAYVSSATSSGDQLFGWDAKGTVQCAPRAGFEAQTTGSPKSQLKTLDPRTDLDQAPSPSATIEVAAITSAPGPTDCDVPSANATIASAAAPDYPMAEQGRGVGASVWVEVAVNPDGSLADAWIYAPSAARDFDEAALVCAIVQV